MDLITFILKCQNFQTWCIPGFFEIIQAYGFKTFLMENLNSCVEITATDNSKYQNSLLKWQMNVHPTTNCPNITNTSLYVHIANMNTRDINPIGNVFMCEDNTLVSSSSPCDGVNDCFSHIAKKNFHLHR